MKMYKTLLIGTAILTTVQITQATELSFTGPVEHTESVKQQSEQLVNNIFSYTLAQSKAPEGIKLINKQVDHPIFGQMYVISHKDDIDYYNNNVKQDTNEELVNNFLYYVAKIDSQGLNPEEVRNSLLRMAGTKVGKNTLKVITSKYMQTYEQIRKFYNDYEDDINEYLTLFPKMQTFYELREKYAKIKQDIKEHDENMKKCIEGHSKTSNESETTLKCYRYAKQAYNCFHKLKDKLFKYVKNEYKEDTKGRLKRTIKGFRACPETTQRRIKALVNQKKTNNSTIKEKLQEQIKLYKEIANIPTGDYQKTTEQIVKKYNFLISNLLDVTSKLKKIYSGTIINLRYIDIQLQKKRLINLDDRTELIDTFDWDYLRQMHEILKNLKNNVSKKNKFDKTIIGGLKYKYQEGENNCHKENGEYCIFLSEIPSHEAGKITNKQKVIPTYSRNIATSKTNTIQHETMHFKDEIQVNTFDATSKVEQMIRYSQNTTFEQNLEKFQNSLKEIEQTALTNRILTKIYDNEHELQTMYGIYYTGQGGHCKFVYDPLNEASATSEKDFLYPEDNIKAIRTGHHGFGNVRTFSSTIQDDKFLIMLDKKTNIFSWHFNPELQKLADL